MKLLDNFYIPVLEAAGLNVDDGGIISKPLSDSDVPLEIHEKILTLPTDAFLKNPDLNNYVAFHPLSEHVERGESEVLKKLRTFLLHRMNQVLSELITNLLCIAADTDSHGTKITPKHVEFLLPLAKADAKMVNNFLAIIKASKKHTGSRFISIHLRRGTKLRGEKYNRVAILSSPFLADADKEERAIFGVKLRKDDVPAFVSLFEAILPDIHDSGYSVGTNSLQCPYLICLLRGFSNVMAATNKVVEFFKDALDDPDSLMVPLDWVSELDDLGRYRDMIPSLDGNAGVISKSTAATSLDNPNAVAGDTPPMTPTPSSPPPLPPTQTPATPPPAAKETPVEDSSGGITFEELMGMPKHQPQQQQPVYTPQQLAYIQQQGMMPPMQTGYPQQPGMQPLQQGLPQSGNWAVQGMYPQQPPLDPRSARINQQKAEQAQEAAAYAQQYGHLTDPNQQAYAQQQAMMQQGYGMPMYPQQGMLQPMQGYPQQGMPGPTGQFDQFGRPI